MHFLRLYLVVIDGSGGDKLKAILGVLLALLAGGTFVSAQESSAVAPSQNSVSATDPQLHKNVLKLVDLMHARSNVQDGQLKAMPEARAKLMQSAPQITDQFADEWVKRMMTDASIDEYIVVIVGTYERHFNNEEIEELIQIQADVNDKKTPTISDTLKAKLAKDSVAIQSEIIGGCTQVGARLGGEIAQQIEKEHPEWLKKLDTSDKSDSKK